jgi:hypothetical protein
VDTSNPGLLKEIMEKKTLDDKMKSEMDRVIKETKESFVAQRKQQSSGKQTAQQQPAAARA